VGKKYLIRDRDPLYTDKLDSILRAAGVDPVKLSPRSPNLSPHAERFVRSVREECLDHLILSSEQQLRYVLSEYLQYYHHERIHQGLNRIIKPQQEGNEGEIICIERLGGLLRSCHRKAARCAHTISSLRQQCAPAYDLNHRRPHPGSMPGLNDPRCLHLPAIFCCDFGGNRLESLVLRPDDFVHHTGQGAARSGPAGD
jgi:hypothetical protein